MANNQHTHNVGKALKRLRKDNGWTLSAVSSKTGVAISTLSKIENSQTSPTYDVLVRLADGLGVDFVEIFSGGSFSTFAHGSRTINRAGDSVRYGTSMGEYHVLSSELTKKILQPMLVHLPQGGQCPEVMSSHGGEEFIYIVSGTVEFHMEPYSTTVMEQGDSVHFDGLMPHWFVAVGEDAWILSVCLSSRENIEQTANATPSNPRGPAAEGKR